MKFSNAFGIVLLALVALTGAIVLVALGHAVPEFVSLVVVTGLGALAGITTPSTGVAAAPALDLGALASGISAELSKLTHATVAASQPQVTSLPATLTMVSPPAVPPAAPVTDQAPAAAPVPPQS